jgi:hypothetical protein
VQAAPWAIEQLTRNEQVSGSSPLLGSHELPAKRRKIRSPDAKEASLPAHPSRPYRGTAKTEVRWLHGLLTTVRKSSLKITRVEI